MWETIEENATRGVYVSRNAKKEMYSFYMTNSDGQRRSWMRKYKPGIEGSSQSVFDGVNASIDANIEQGWTA